MKVPEMHILVLVVSCIVYVNCAVLSGKAIYCRDPDTGKLHAVNTTWSSSSFCGNYTCKLRRRNITETEYVPLRQLNVTMHDHASDKNKMATIHNKIEPDVTTLPPSFQQNRDNVISSTTDNLQQKYSESTEKNTNTINQKPQFKDDESIEDIQVKPVEKVKPIEKNNEFISKPQGDNDDRYLTEEEINSIANVLHTVKKTDLDAIVDIYNLAQDIYKEIDKVTDEDMVSEAINLIKEQEKHSTPTMQKFRPNSYWYHPFGNKGKMADRYDLEHQSTNVIHTTVKPKTNLPTYFSGPLTRNDFGKLPYYYPVTDFQRASSYTHQPISIKAVVNNGGLKENSPTCKTKNSQERHSNTIKRPDSQKLIQPSLLLPYPFASVYHNNSSEYPNRFYYNIKPADYYNKYRYYQPYYNAFIAPIPRAILVNPHLSNEVQDEEQKPIYRFEENKIVDNPIPKNDNKPSWKTGPLSVEVLRDIRANVDTSKLIKAFPFRKKVTLDRVGKVIKIDDFNNSKERCKRSSDKQIETKEVIDDIEKYEAYLEKVTCETETDPGFFRIGNLTHPFPGCCPQKIHSEKNH